MSNGENPESIELADHQIASVSIGKLRKLAALSTERFKGVGGKRVIEVKNNEDRSARSYQWWDGRVKQES